MTVDPEDRGTDPNVDIWKDLSLELTRLRMSRTTKQTDIVFDDDMQRIMTTWLGKNEYDHLRWEKGVKVKGGRFSRKEQEFLRNFVFEFLDRRGISLDVFQYLIREACLRESSLYGIITPIFREASLGLKAGRALSSVCAHIKRAFHPDNSPVLWTVELDKRLLELVTSKGPSWASIGRELNIYYKQCKARYFTIAGGYARGYWSDEETIIMINAVEELKIIRRAVRGPFWVVVSEMLGRRRSPAQCIVRWNEVVAYRMKNRGLNTVSWTRFEDYSLVTALYNLGVEDESEINWGALIQDRSTGLYNRTSVKLYNRWRLLRRRIHGNEEMDMDSIMESILMSLQPHVSHLVDQGSYEIPSEPEDSRPESES